MYQVFKKYQEIKQLLLSLQMHPFSELMQCFSSFQSEAGSVVMAHLCLLQEDSEHQSPVFLSILNVEYVNFGRSMGNFNFYAVLS